MAEGFAKKFAGKSLEVYSAGSKPSETLNPQAIKAMQEIGIDISSNKPKGFNDLPLREFDLAVTLGCKDICPFVPAERHIEWQVEDPKGKDINTFRKVRDQIVDKVVNLLKEVYNQGE